MPYSGKFVIRIDKTLHHHLVAKAREMGYSLNCMCATLLATGLRQNILAEGPNELSPSLKNLLHPLVDKFSERFGPHLLGIMAFGSRVAGTASLRSDLDLLIILSDEETICRSLYTWWEETVSYTSSFEINPHFVHLPNQTEEAGGLWMEVAMDGRIVWQQDSQVTEWINQLQQAIAQDHARRYWSHGHPYWVKKT